MKLRNNLLNNIEANKKLNSDHKSTQQNLNQSTMYNVPYENMKNISINTGTV